MISLDTFMAVAAGGLVLGAIYALMAAGLATIWTTLGIFNFAHGSFIALGAYIGWQFTDAQTGGWALWSPPSARWPRFSSLAYAFICCWCARLNGAPISSPHR
jgi:branched-subunit amino acid ABC-type transport system permease component